MKSLHLAAIIALFQPSLLADLFHSNSAVADLSGATFEKKIHKTKHVTFVKFYAPWCGHCKNLAPTYAKVADKLKGIAKVVSINCDKEENKPVCGKYGIQGFPTLKLFPSSLVTKGRTKSPIDYNGPRERRDISKFIVDNIPDKVFIVVNEDKDTKKIKNIDKFLELKSSTGDTSPFILLFTDKSDTPPLYKSLAVEYHDRAIFGIVRKKSSEIFKKYDITKSPTLIVLPTSSADDETDKSAPVVYDGPNQHKSMLEFIGKYALPSSNGKKSKDEKPKSESKPKADSESEAESETSGEPAPEEEIFDPNVTELAEQEEFEKRCLDESGICVLGLFYPGDNDQYIENIKDMKKKLHNLKSFNLLPSNTPKVNFHYSTIASHTFLMKQFSIPTETNHPITLVLQPKRQLYAFESHEPENHKDSLQTFLEDTVKGKTKLFKYTFTPKLKKIKKAKKAKDTSEKDEL